MASTSKRAPKGGSGRPAAKPKPKTARKGCPVTAATRMTASTLTKFNSLKREADKAAAMCESLLKDIAADAQGKDWCWRLLSLLSFVLVLAGGSPGR